MKKSILLTVVVILCLCIATYASIMFYMVKSVKNIEEDFYAVTHNQKSPDIDYGMLLYYDYTDECEIESVKEYEFDLDYVWHNTKRGYVEVTYRYLINGKVEKNYRGSSGVSRWYIEKRNNRWIVTKIEEPFGAVTIVRTLDGSVVVNK